METLSCHSNQINKPIFIKKHKLSFPKPKDATHKIWAQSAQWFRQRRFLNVFLVIFCILVTMATNKKSSGKKAYGY